MNWLFRFFVFIGFLVVLALFSALLAPYFVSWDRFTKEFEAQASRIVGQPVTVGGDSSLRILPLPFISFEELSIGRNADGSPLMTVDEFSLRAELFPFLSGEVRIVEMSMDQPHLNLQVEENGTIAWTAPKEALVDPEQVNIEKLLINNGSVNITGLAGGRSLEVKDMSGDFTARSVAGPWRIEADAVVDEIPTRFTISTGSYRREEGALRLRLDAFRKDEPYKLQLDGPVKLEDEVLQWSGAFTLAPHVGEATSSFSRGEDPLPVHTSGTFVASPELVSVEEYRMEVGSRDDPYVITGKGQLAFRDTVFFNMTADGRQVDLDRLEANQSNEGPTSLERRLEVVRGILDRIPVPASQGEIDALLPAIVAGDTFIRDIKARVRPFGKGWELRSFNATFPGNTLVEASGRVGTGNEFGFAGSMILASRQPSGLAAWLSGGVDAQIRRLKTLGFSSDVTLSLNQAILDNLELRMDDAALTGKLKRLAPVAGRAALVAELEGNRVNLQDLQALYSLTQERESVNVASHDLDVKIKAAMLELVYADVPIEAKGVDGWVRVKDGNISIEKLHANDVYGARIASSGRLEQVLQSPNGNFKLDVDAADARQFLDFVSKFTGDFPLLETWTGEASLTKDTSLKIELDTRSVDSGAKGLLLVGGEAGGSAIKSRIGFNGDVSAPSAIELDSEFSISNASVDTIMRQFGIETLPSDLIGVVEGPASLTVSLKGTGEEGFETRLSANGRDTSIAARGTSKVVSRYDVEAALDVTLGSANLAPYLVMAGVRLPGVGVSTPMPVSLQFDLDAKEGVASFKDLSGQIAGNSVSGELAYQYAGLQRPRLSGDVKLSNLPMPILAESIFGYSTLLGAGDLIPIEEREFQSTLFAGKDAKISLSADRLDTGFGFDAAKARAELVMLNGEMDINDLSFEAFGGTINSSFSLKNSDGLVFGRMQYALQNASFEELLSHSGIPGFATGKVMLSGSLETSGRSQNGMLANLSGNGFISLEEAEVTGVDPKSFGDILLRADVDGFEADTSNVEELVSDTVLDSGFGIDAVDAPYSIARGRARIRNLVLTGEEADFNSSLEIDMVSGTLDGSTSLSFKPGIRERIRGAEPVVRLAWNGAMGDPVQTIDANQLEGYLSLRAFEAAQRRVETLEARVIETQRIQRQIAFSFAREQYRERILEEERLRLEELQRRIEAEEIKRLEEAVRKLSDERKRVAEEKLRAEQERQRQAELERQREAERKAAEEAKKREEEERRRQAALERQQEAERIAAEEAARIAEEEKQREAELARQREAEQQAAAEAAARQAAEAAAIRERARQEELSKQEDAPLQQRILESIDRFLQSN